MTGEWEKKAETEIKNLQDMTEQIDANSIPARVAKVWQDQQGGIKTTGPVDDIMNKFQNIANTFGIINFFMMFDEVIKKIALSNMNNETKAKLIRKLIYHIIEEHLKPTLEETPNPQQ